MSDISTPSTQSLSEINQQRQNAAHRIFRKLAKSYLEKQKAPSQEEQSKLWDYAEAIDLKTFIQWRDETDIRNGVHVDHGKSDFQ